MAFTNIDSETLLQLVKEGAQVIDVRTDAEVAKGVIPGAKHIALDKFAARANEFDSEAQIILYCQVGGRSANAAQFLVSKGFQKVFNLQGGINSWLTSGHEIGSLA